MSSIGTVYVSVEIELGWESCKKCRYFDFVQEKCSLGIKDENDERIQHDSYDGAGVFCLKFKEGKPIDPEAIDEKIRSGELYVDHPLQCMLFKDVKIVTREDYLRAGEY